MCEGIPLFADNKKALFGVGTSSHSAAAEMLKINEDNFRKYEYHWWDKQLVTDQYDETAERILANIDKDKALKNVKRLVKKEFNTEGKIVKWLKKTPEEWKRLFDPKLKKIGMKVHPKLYFYEKKLKKFKVSEKTNPYQAKKLPSLARLKKVMPRKVRNQIWAQVRDQVRDQVGDQIWAQIWAQVGAQIWDQVGAQVRNQIWDQVRNQIWDQVRNQVRNQIWDQVGATSYWAIKVALKLPTKHWFFNFLKLGVMIVFVQGKAKVFGKKGKYLGEYDQNDL